MTTQLTLKIFRDDELVDTKTFSQETIKIGKLPGSDLRLSDVAIARMHAVIEVSGDDASIMDLGSARGTFLNGDPVLKTTPISQGDSLTFGPFQVEVTEIKDVPEVATAEPDAAEPAKAGPEPDATEDDEAEELTLKVRVAIEAENPLVAAFEAIQALAPDEVRSYEAFQETARELIRKL